MKIIIIFISLCFFCSDYANAYDLFGVYRCNVFVSAKIKSFGVIKNYSGDFNSFDGADEAGVLTSPYEEARGNFMATWSEQSNPYDFGGMSLTLEDDGTVRNDDVSKRGIYSAVLPILAQNKQVCFPKKWSGGERLGNYVTPKGRLSNEDNPLVLKGTVYGNIVFGQCIDVGLKKRKRNGGYADLTVKYDCLLQ